MVKPKHLERLEKLLSFGIYSLIFISIGTVFGFYHFYKQKNAVQEVSQNRINSILIADELRQTSDNLTRLARNYVITQKPAFKEQYLNVVKIRNGEIRRPDTTTSIYFDRLTDSGIKTTAPNGKPFSLIQIAKNTGINPNEIKILMYAKALSDALAVREEKAFDAIAKNDSKTAQELMFDKEYLKQKDKILLGVNNFYKALNIRTQKEVSNQERSLGNITFVMLLLFLLAILTFIIVVYAYRKINKNTSDAYKQIETYSENLVHLNESKNKFFSIVAHDIRSPFNGFLGMSRLLANEIDTLSKEEIQYFGKSMEKSASGLYEFLENLLDWANVETGTAVYKPEILNFYKISNSTIELNEAFASNKNITIKNFIPENTFVFADERMINIVLRNLISNAIKFTSIGGNIEVGMMNDFNSSNHRTFYVKDNGIGISETDIYDIFRITKKTSREGTEGEKGTGLGLILCKQFIEKNDGKIWVESTLNEGATFYFTLPVSH